MERKEWRGREQGEGYLRDLPEGGEGLPQRLRLNFRTEVADEDVVVLCKRQEGKGSHSSARLFLYFGLGWVKLYTLVQKKCALFEILSFLLPTNLGQPMYRQSALTELPSPSLALFLLLDPAVTWLRSKTQPMFHDENLGFLSPKVAIDRRGLRRGTVTNLNATATSQIFATEASYSRNLRLVVDILLS